LVVFAKDTPANAARLSAVAQAMTAAVARRALMVRVSMVPSVRFPGRLPAAEFIKHDHPPRVAVAARAPGSARGEDGVLRPLGKAMAATQHSGLRPVSATARHRQAGVGRARSCARHLHALVTARLLSATGQLADMRNGTIRVEIWNAIGNSPTTLDTADAYIDTPYTSATPSAMRTYVRTKLLDSHEVIDATLTGSTTRSARTPSPSSSHDYNQAAPGEKGGPLHVRVTGGGHRAVYDYSGWMVVVPRAPGRSRLSPSRARANGSDQLPPATPRRPAIKRRSR
jgi:hypothetical protein